MSDCCQLNVVFNVYSGRGSGWVVVMRCTCDVVNSPAETSHRVHRVSLDLSHLFFTPQVDTLIDRLHIDFSAHNKLLINTPPNCVSVFISRPISGLLGIIGRPILMKIGQSCKTQWPRPPLFLPSWLIQWSMRDGSYITFFSPSDVTAFYRMKYGGGVVI